MAHNNTKSLVKRISSGIAWGQIGKLFEVGLGFTYTILLGRNLGPSGYGIYTLFLSVVNSVILFTSLGFSEILGRFIPKVLSDYGQISFLIRRLFRQRIFVLLYFSIMLYLLQETILGRLGIPKYIGFMAILILTYGITDLFTSFFIALLKIKVVILTKVATQSIGLIFIVALFKFIGPTVKIALYASTIASLFTVMFYLFQSRRYILFNSRQTISLKSIYRFGVMVWLVNISTLALGNNIDRIFIGYLIRDTAQIGYYSVASVMLMTLYSLFTSGFGITILPALSESYAKYDIQGLVQAWSSYCKIFIFIMLPSVMFLSHYAELIITTLFGNSYSQSIIFLKVYILLNLVEVFLGSGISYQALYVIGREKLILSLRLLCGIVNIILALSLIPIYGALGAIWATGISVALINMLEFISLTRYAPVRYPVIFAGKVILAVAISLLIIFRIKVENFLSLFSAGILYILLLIVSYYFIKPLDRQDKELLTKLDWKPAFIFKYF